MKFPNFMLRAMFPKGDIVEHVLDADEELEEL